MHLEWRDALAALGLAIALEGLAYAAAPGAMKRMLAALRETAPNLLRAAGLTGVVVGLAIVAFARG